MVQNDTRLVLDSGSSSASRSHHVIGICTQRAADALLSAMRKEDGSYRTYSEMKAAHIPTRYEGSFDSTGMWSDIDPDTGHGWGNFAQNYMLFIAEVEVEAATGRTRVLGMHVDADVGTLGNRQAVLGQAYSGIFHSIGYALSEDFSDYRKHITMGGAGVPLANAVPDGEDFDVRFHVTPRPDGPLGSTGCSEGFQTSGHVAILNAIHDAVGVRIRSLPATPEKILAAIASKNGPASDISQAFDLGCSLYDRLETLRVHPAKPKNE